MVVRSYLYVPGDQPELVAKAVASEADAIVLDLEDSVPADPAAKARARAVAVRVLSEPAAKPILVRINRADSAEGDADLKAVRATTPAAIRLPKCESREVVRAVADRVSDQVELHCLIESALGLERAFELATASANVAGLALGEADLSADLGARTDEALAYARSRCVVAARAAQLVPPVQSVFPQLGDDAALRASCLHGRAMGFFGRSAIHPRQLSTINDVYTPSSDEVARASDVVEGLRRARVRGHGGAVLADGSYVDAGVARAAVDLLRLHRSLVGDAA